MDYNKIVEFYLKKMCEFAGIDYSLVNFDDEWNSGYTWTKAQRHKFLVWMVENLRTHKAIRNMVMESPEKKNIPQFVSSWVAAYGFKIDEK